MELPQQTGWVKPTFHVKDSDIRAAVQTALKVWAECKPAEVKATKRWLSDHKARQATRSGKTGEGEHVLGAFPQSLYMAMKIYFDDPNWMINNKSAIGILFDEFEIGRFAHWDGTGAAGAGGRVTLNEADSK